MYQTYEEREAIELNEYFKEYRDYAVESTFAQETGYYNEWD